jgi:hypothetical protein
MGASAPELASSDVRVDPLKPRTDIQWDQGAMPAETADFQQVRCEPELHLRIDRNAELTRDILRPTVWDDTRAARREMMLPAPTQPVAAPSPPLYSYATPYATYHPTSLGAHHSPIESIGPVAAPSCQSLRCQVNCQPATLGITSVLLRRVLPHSLFAERWLARWEENAAECSGFRSRRNFRCSCA